MGGGLPPDPSQEEPPAQARILIDATAGAMAGCVARICVGPLDVIKIRFQVQLEPIRRAGRALASSKYTGFMQAMRTIFLEEGVQGLWRGTVPGLLLTVPYTAVQFVALHQVKDAASYYGLTANPMTAPWMPFLSGAMAGTAGTIASYPFDLLRTTMAAQGEPRVYDNMWSAARGIVHERGLRGLYSGLGVTIMEIVPYAALQFGLYDVLQTAWQGAKAKHQLYRQSTSVSQSLWGSQDPLWYDSRAANFACGLMAGLCAKLTTHPLDVVKKRYQVAGLQRSLSYGARVTPKFMLNSMAAGLTAVYRQEGLSGLWKGSIPSVIKAAPSAAITFTAYEVILAWMLAGSSQALASQAFSESKA